jgi:hypothetical protein
MGGLVARYFLEVLEGWKSTRALITFGTPYRGSLNTVNALSNGMKKGPFGLLDLTRLARSLTSLYQLLPTYRCYDPGTGTMHRVHEKPDVPNIALDRATEAARFHREIREAVEENLKSTRYRDEGYKIFPVVGIAQRTYQSARRDGSKVEMQHVDFEGEDKGGDGTVPRVSAMPLELSKSSREIFSGTKHASLQNGDTTLINLDGILSSLYFDLGTFRSHTVDPTTVSLEAEDLHWSSEPIIVNARVNESSDDAREDRLIAHLTDRAANRPVEAKEMTRRSDRDYTVAFEPPGEGVYEVRVTGGAGVEPVEDAFAVAGIGPDEVDLPDALALEDIEQETPKHEDMGRARSVDG